MSAVKTGLCRCHVALSAIMRNVNVLEDLTSVCGLGCYFIVWLGYCNGHKRICRFTSAEGLMYVSFIDNNPPPHTHKLALI